MLKAIVNFFAPSKKLAGATAAEVQRKVNAQGQSRKEVIAKYAKMAKRLSDTASQLAQIAADGEVSDAEREELACILEPLYAEGRELIGL